MAEREIVIGQQFRKRGFLHHIWQVVAVTEVAHAPRHAVLMRLDDRTETKTISCPTLADPYYYERVPSPTPE
jgi:hypothetical protein